MYLQSRAFLGFSEQGTPFQERSDGGYATSLGDFEWLNNCQLARPQPTVVARCVKRGIYRIVVKHFDTLESVELSPEKAALLQSFANFRE